MLPPLLKRETVAELTPITLPSADWVSPSAFAARTTALVRTALGSISE